MPRAGHKEGCQCAVCKVVDAKALREEIPQAPAELVPLKTLGVGSKFKYQAQTYIKYGTDKKGIVAAEGVAGVIRLNENTLV